MTPTTATSTTTQSTTNSTTAAADVRELFFTAKPSLHRHVELILQQQGAYLSELDTICQKGVVSTLSQPTKALILATLHMTGHQPRVSDFLKHCDVVAIVKACQILDRPRRIKQLEQRIAAIEHAHPELVVDDNIKIEEEAAAQKTSKPKHNVRIAKKGDEADDPPKKKRKRRIDVYRSQLKNAKLFLNGGGAQPAVQEVIESASLSGAFSKKVRRWAKDLKADFLEFIVMSGSLKLWKELADWVHFAPEDFSLSYFLATAHGQALSEDSFVFGMRSLVEAVQDRTADESGLVEQFQTLARAHPQVYQAFNFLRTYERLLQTPEIAALLAEHCDLSTVVWYLEEIAQSNTAVLGTVARRLRSENWMDKSSKVAGSFGKLLERILTFQAKKDPVQERSDQVRAVLPDMGEGFVQLALECYHNDVEQAVMALLMLGTPEEHEIPARLRQADPLLQRENAAGAGDGAVGGWRDVADCLKPAAEKRLKALKEKWMGHSNKEDEGLTVVFGDKSASMTSAIQAATIIAAMVSVCFQGELCFFDRVHVASPHKCPTTVEHVLEVVETVRADYATSMAAALWPYYQKKIKIGRIILVSDEGENEGSHGFMFAPLLKKYMTEVNDQVELISICVDSGHPPFREALERELIHCKRIEIDGHRPDLSKFDLLLGKIALLSQRSRKDDEDFVVVDAEVQS